MYSYKTYVVEMKALMAKRMNTDIPTTPLFLACELSAHTQKVGNTKAPGHICWV
jgi:hypothetical protein